jgi:myo-inositol-hexaphosphate 3-phosphohydrolase
MFKTHSLFCLPGLYRSAPLALLATVLSIHLSSPVRSRTQGDTLSAGSVAPVVETQPMPHTGDSADDPAIWIHPTNTAESTIIGTDKQGGIAVYDLAGSLLQYLADGKMNNVDLRYNVPVGGQRITLVAATNRTDNSIALYKVNPSTRLLESIAGDTIKPSVPAYGACMYRSAQSGKYYLFITSSTGAVEQWELFDNGSGKVNGTRVRSFSVGSAVEGCVADDELARFYVSEETVGIWRYGAEPGDGSARVAVDLVSSGTGLSSDVEGLTIYYTSARSGYLMVSSQGTDSYLVYRREGDNSYIDTFVIGRNSTKGIDAVQGTDGIDVSNANLGSAFPQGVFIAQDDANDVGSQNLQNFKLVPWQSIANAFDPDLAIDTNWDARRIGAPEPSPTPSPTPSPSPTPTPSPPPPNNQARLRPEADARIEQANASANFGSDPILRADGASGLGVRSYLRFNVAGITRSIQSAKVRLYATTSTGNGPSIHSTSNSWTESAITWNSRPGYSATALDDRGSVTANTWVEYDVSPVVKRNSTYSFVLVSTSSDGLTLLSREGSAQPELILTLGAPLHQVFVPISKAGS